VDPLSLAVGAVLLAVGVLAGEVHGRHAARRQRAEPSQPVCGCQHHRSMHADGGKGECMVAVGDESVFNSRGDWIGRRPVGCACQQYVGPEPISSLWTPPVLPEGSDR